ncbi:hypothetical protein ACIHAR_36615 [Streptomyces sp. NPDC052016]|uniref:hypothetical protein n=1 Tax=unclassified Streptomyces TaxID=2593676 RepID=UPI00343DF1ED
MHRTTSTTATLLLTVSALTGCVTVQYPPVPGPPARASQPSVPVPSVSRPDRQAGTHVVQSPALEALERVGRGRGPESTPPPQRRRAAPATPAAEPPPARSHPQPKPHRQPHPRSARPEPRRPAHPPVAVPDVRNEGHGNSGVCALGRQYGGWRADSPEAVICEGTYGR